MGEIKSAYEIAMEKVGKIGNPTDEELLEWKYKPEGEKLAARYLREDIDLIAEINKLEAKGIKYAIEGAISILARNIQLPKNESIKKTNKKALDGIKALKKEKVRVENVFSQIRRLFNYYSENGEQQRKQAYQQVKAAFEAKVQQAIEQQMGVSAGIKIDVEKHPQFQEEWRRAQNQLDDQYVSLLNEYIQELLNIP